MWKTCVFSLGLMSSLVYAEMDADQSQTLIPNPRMASQPQSSREEVSQNRNQMMGQRQNQNSVEQRLSDLEKIHKHPADFEPTEINGRGVFHLEGEFLYWKFVNDGMPIGIFAAELNPIVGIPGAYNDASTVNVTFDHDPGFRIGGGYTLPYYEWDINSTWVRLHSKSSVGANGNGSTTMFLPYWHSIPSFSTQFPVNASADMSIDYDAWDILLGRIFTLYSVFALNPMIGMQMAWIDQKETIAVNGQNDAVTPKFVDISLQNKLKGIGIKAGSNLRMIIGWGFELYGNFFATLYSAKFRLRAREESLEGTNFITSFSDYPITLSCTEIDLNVGLKWGIYFYKQAYASFFVGYEQRNIINFNQLEQIILFPSVINQVPSTQINPQPGDLQLRGLTLGGKVFF